MFQALRRPVDEVELRLSPGADGGTVLELEHASVLFAGEGVGAAWEWWLDRLASLLRGEEPDTDEAAAESRFTQRNDTWLAIVEAAAAARSGETRPAG